MFNSTMLKEHESIFIPLSLESFRLRDPKPINPMFETLPDVEATLRKHFEIVDWQGVELLLAAAVAHYAPGEMLWLREIGPSRSGKTELLRAISAHSDCARMEAIGFIWLWLKIKISEKRVKIR